MTMDLLSQTSNILSSKLANFGLYAASIGVVLIALCIWIVCGFLAWRFLQKKQETAFWLRLTSGSNLTTHYQLKLDLGKMDRKVKVFCQVKGQKLPVKAVKEVTYIEKELPAAPDRSQARAKVNTVAKTANTAKEKTQKVSAFVGIFASIASTLAGILPGDLKTPFQDFASSIRSGQQSVNSAVREPERLQRSAQAIKADANRVGTTVGVKPNGHKRQGDQNAQASEVTPASSRLAITHAYQMIETQPFAPAESQPCRLTFQPRNPLRKLKGNFQLVSQPFELNDMPLSGPIKPQSLAGDLQLKASHPLYVIFAVFFCIGAFIVNAWWSLMIVQWLLQFVQVA